MNNMGFFNPFGEGGSGGGGGGGTSNYNDLTNKPKINSVPLTGNKSLEDLGIVNPVVDSELSTTSENPVQNKIVTQVINEKLDIDDAVGKNTTDTEYTIGEQTIVAQAGAEIFNDYVNNKAAGRYSHAEGEGSQALGVNSHAEGSGTQATGTQSHAEGQGTIAAGKNQHTQGKYNIQDANNKYAFIIGNGTSNSNRSNAFAVDWNGKIYQGNTNNGVNLVDQQKEIDYAINTGAKNLLKITASSQTKNGVTLTVNSDGSVSLDGTATSSTTFSLNNTMGLPYGQYILSGNVPNKVFLTARSTSGTNYTVTNSNTEIKIDADIFYVYINISSGLTLNNAVIKPMLRPASITDSTFQPYAPTNRELYEAKTEQTETNVIANFGAKNLLKITASSQTIRGVTFTVNDDQTVTVNGTNDGTGASEFVIVPNAQAITIPDGNYILSGCPTGGGADVSTAPYDLRWYMYSPGKSAYDSGNGASIEKSGNGTGSNIAIVVKTRQTANNLVFKPMIRRAEITDDTFQPYAPTNRQLYEAKITMEGILGAGRQLTDTEGQDALVLGKFYCANAADAGSISTSPWNSAYFGFTMRSVSTSQRFVQIAIQNDDSFNMAKRRYTGSWQPWAYITDTASASTKSVNQVSTLNLSRNDLNESLDTNFDLIDSIPEEEEVEER